MYTHIYGNVQYLINWPQNTQKIKTGQNSQSGFLRNNTIIRLPGIFHSGRGVVDSTVDVRSYEVGRLSQQHRDAQLGSPAQPGLNSAFTVYNTQLQVSISEAYGSFTSISLAILYPSLTLKFNLIN